MKLKLVKPSRFLILTFLCITLALFAQTGQKPTKPADGAGADDQFRDVHREIGNPAPDKAKEAVRLTNETSKLLPGDRQPVSEIPRSNFIDDIVFAKIERDGIPHANLSNDEEFIRRVTLDATGLLPTPDQVKEFVASKDPDKRNRLIDSLIGTEEFAEQWAWFYGDLFRLMNYAGGAKNAFQYWNKEWLKVDRPYNEVVTDMLTGASKSHSSIPQLAFLGRVLRNDGLKNRDLTDPDNYGATTNRLDAIDAMSIEISRNFLGVNTQCLACHDGPGHLESVNLFQADHTREDFASQAAFLGKLRPIGIYNVNNSDSVMDNGAKGYDTGNDAPFYTEAEGVFPRSGKTYEPTFMLTGEKARPGFEPRAEFARMLTKHIQFSRATVNLIWGRLMTIAFVEPYDAFDLYRLDPANPPEKPWTIQPTNPELLEAMAHDFRNNNYSIQGLIKKIMKSSAYQLSSQFPGDWKDDYMPYYARKYVRVMTGPEIVDTIAQATGRPYKFQFAGTEVTRFKQLTDLGDVPGGRRGAGAKEGQDITSLSNSFFETNREAPVPAGNKATTLQAILMMSSDLVTGRVLAEKGGRVQSILESGDSDGKMIEDLFLSSLSRRPTPDEKRASIEIFQFQKDRKHALENLQWTLLNSIEFILNH